MPCQVSVPDVVDGADEQAAATAAIAMPPATPASFFKFPPQGQAVSAACLSQEPAEVNRGLGNEQAAIDAVRMNMRLMIPAMGPRGHDAGLRSH